MTTEYGVTAAGFVPKTLDAVHESLKADLRAEFGASINLEPSSVFAQIAGIMAAAYAELWEAHEEVYDSFYPDSSIGASLDNVSALTGCSRLPAARTRVMGTLFGTAGTVVSVGKVTSVTGSGKRFSLLAGATIVAVPAWANSTAYTVGARRSNGGKTYECITAGTSAGSGGPTGTGANITDGTVHWRYVATTTACADGAFDCEETGPVPAYAGTLTTIETPVSGWDGVVNLDDHGSLGRAVETDAELRLRREAQLASSGSATVDAIRADVMAVSGVTGCTVFENDTDTTNGDGMPPHSLEPLVTGGEDAEIAAAIWSSKGGGAATCGSTTVSVNDSEGNPHDVKFSRATQIDAYAAVTLVKDAATWPADGDAQVKQAIATWAAAYYQNGEDVHASQLYVPTFGVAGVVRITGLTVGTTPGPVGASIAIGTREIAAFSTSRITVTAS